MNRRQRRAKRAQTRRYDVAMRIVPGSLVRFSSILRSLRRQGPRARVAIDALEELRVNVGHCAEHGELDDPLVFTMPQSQASGLDVPRHDVAPADGSNFVVLACPWCSPGELRATWEREGMAS